MSMFHLVYVSTAVKSFSTDELLELLRQAREKNARRGITGLLLYKDGAFIQALEGRERAVHAIYASICADPRHHHIHTLVSMPVLKRQFSNWSMGFKNLGNTDLSAVPGYNLFPSLRMPDDALPWKSALTLSLLASFERENLSDSV